MAIKISGTTVIDNSRTFCNIGTATATCFVGDGSSVTGVGADRIFKPGNQEPADAATGVELVPTLTGTCFVSTEGSTHVCTCFQVSECSDFSTCNSFTCEIAGGCTSITVPSGCLSDNTQHFFRLRYEDNDGCCSEFSDATCFTTAVAPSTLGESICGGFYLGTICAASTCYYLIVAPNATGCACCRWKNLKTCSNVGNELCDGYGNTYDHLANSSHEAGNWTATRTIGGFSDWYLPAIAEIEAVYPNRNSVLSAERFNCCVYWASTESGISRAAGLLMCLGLRDNNEKTDRRFVRAFRRVPF